MRFCLSLLIIVALSAEERPDVVIILADDFGWGEIGGTAELEPTPHIDRMAAAGIKFTQGYVASPICSPSRCGLLTGQHPARWRITSYLQSRKGNAECGQADYLSAQAPTLPRFLQAAGYATAHIGKWHLGGGRDVTDAPKFSAYGYDLGMGTYESPEPHPDITASEWIWSKKDPIKRWDRTHWMIDQTITFMDSHKDKPCFVNLWLDDTHTPWVPSASMQDDESQFSTPAALAGVVREMDTQIGRLMNWIKQRSRPTVVIFLGDNGPLPTFEAQRAGGLRGAKLSLYEGGIRVPFIVWAPHIIHTPRVDQTSVISALDVLPTICALAGMILPVDYASAGQDLTPALRGATITRKQPLMYEYGRNKKSYKYPTGRDRSPNLAIREEAWKLLINDDGSDVQLYDLQQDSQETRNVASEHTEVVQRLKSHLITWRQALP